MSQPQPDTPQELHALLADDTAIVIGIIKLAHSLDKTVIAEGIETDDPRAILAQGLCEEIQRTLVSSSLPPRDLVNWLNNRERNKTDLKPIVGLGEADSQ